MREEHPVFDTKIDVDTVIWRYFDFPKFVSLLQSRALYFSRANLLGDPLEGSVTRAREAARRRLLQNPPKGRSREELERVFEHNARIVRQAPGCTYINCWHMGDHESMAMWLGYGGGPYGVAIRSTFGLLDDLLPIDFPDSPMPHVFIGRVKYIDYQSEEQQVPEEYNAYGPFLCKSIPYQHESELRAVFADMSFFDRSDAPPGHLIPLDVEGLICGVTVSPLSPPWFDGVVNETCGRFGCPANVSRSSVFGEPIY